MDINTKYYSVSRAAISWISTIAASEAATWAGRTLAQAHLLDTAALHADLFQGAGFGLITKGVALAATPLLSLWMTNEKMIAIAANVFGGLAAFGAFSAAAALGITAPVSIPVAITLTILSVAIALLLPTDKKSSLRLIDASQADQDLEQVRQDLTAEKKAHNETKDTWKQRVTTLTSEKLELEKEKKDLKIEDAKHQARIKALEEEIAAQNNRKKDDSKPPVHTLSLASEPQQLTPDQSYLLGVRIFKDDRTLDPTLSKGYRMILDAACGGHEEAKVYLECLKKISRMPRRIDEITHDLVLKFKDSHKNAKFHESIDEMARQQQDEMKNAKLAENAKQAEKANSGDSKAAFELAQEYYNSGDYKQAFYLFQKAANGGNAVAMRFLGECHEYGHGVVQDWDQAFTYYSNAASNGDLEAKCRVGDALAFGRGSSSKHMDIYFWSAVDKSATYICDKQLFADADCKSAFALYKEAADRNYMPAKIRLALMHHNGLGTPKNQYLAFEIIQEYRERAHMNHPYLLNLDNVSIRKS